MWSRSCRASDVLVCPGHTVMPAVPRHVRRPGLRLLGVLALVAGAFAVRLAPTMAQEAAPRPKRILLIYDENRDFSGLALLDRSLRAALNASPAHRLEVYTEYMDRSRFPDARYEDRLRDFFHDKYGSRKIDLVIPVMKPSLDFVLKYRTELFPGVPVVFCGIDLRELAGRELPADVTGVLMNRQFKPTLDLALQLQPDTEQVVFIAGVSEFNKYWLEQAQRELKEFDDRVSVRYMTTLPMEEVKREVARLPPHTIILYLHVFRDAAGNTFTPLDSLSQVVASAGAPVYVFLDQYFGRGVVGGRVFSMDRQGTKVAEAALRILDGTRVEDIELSSEGTNLTLLDWRELERWRIPQSRVPPDADVQFRVTTLWEQYRWQIVAIVTLVGVQGLLIFTLLAQRARRRRTEEALAESHRRVEYLAGRLITAQEEERHHIARELHDDLNQHVAALAIGISRLGHQLPAGNAVKPQIDILKENTSRLSQRIRRMSHRLHSTVLEHVNLGAALEELRTELGDIEGVNANLHVIGDVDAIPPDAALCLYRVAQESLHNVVKHSGVTAAELALTVRPDTIELVVSDEGTGFDPDQQPDHGGLGLVSMEERIRLLNGTLHVTTGPGKGTNVKVRLPLQRHQPALASVPSA